ncbi:MAG: FtsW/RodA/SpoVE family cell cycle protein, partial [Candidatus Paceibacteria bacterium]
SRLHILWILSLGLGVVLLAGVLIAITSYRIDRVQTYLDFVSKNQAELCSSESNKENRYHRCQNLIAVGSGGVTGVGLGQGVQKFNYVPKATNDSIFAVYAEETGFVGVSIFLGIIIWIIYRALVIAGTHRSDDFARLVILGIISWFVLQIFINIGSTIGLLPITGVTLPFVSQGSTSLIVLFVAFGIIANISKTPSDPKAR